jgi:CheY-like chemotaxis protein
MRVTVVNDNPEFLELVRDILEDDRYETTTIDGDRPDTIEAVKASRPDLLMIDVRLDVEGDHGWEITQKVRADDAFADLPVVLCCTDPLALDELADQIDTSRRVVTLMKPFSIDGLTEAVDRALGHPAGR